MTFSEISRKTVGDFLNTAVLVDDQIQWGPIPIIVAEAELEAPDLDEFDHNVEEEVNIEAAPHQPVSVDAKALVQAFSSKGIVCSPYEWVEGSDFPNSTEKADLLILDWKLSDDDQEGLTKTFIRNRLLRDAKETRLRLITIYTFESEEDVLGSLIEVLDAETEVVATRLDSRIDVRNDEGHLINRIHWVSKNETENEGELVEKTIEHFSQFVDGFVPNILLSAITEVRNRTYEYLAQYHSGLDVAMIAHYTALKVSETGLDTAEGQFRNYASNLIGSTIQGSLDYSPGIKRATSKSSIIKILEEKEDLLLVNNHDAKKCDNKDKIIEILKSIKLSTLTQRIEKNFKKYKEGKWPTFFLDNAGDHSDKLELTIIDLLKRRKVEFDTRPVLRMGTLVKHNTKDVYYLCVQPLCDGVRLAKNEKHKFPFLKLKEITDNKNFNLVVPFENEFKKFKCDVKPNNISSFPFTSNNNNTLDIRAKSYRGKYFFTSTRKDCSFEWLGELKDVYAQEFLNKLASQGSRVGSDKFEWFRLKSGG